MISISKNGCIDKLDDIVNKYNNAYHRIIKTKSIVVKCIVVLTLILKILITILNLKLVIMQQYQYIKTFSHNNIQFERYLENKKY